MKTLGRVLAALTVAGVVAIFYFANSPDILWVTHNEATGYNVASSATYQFYAVLTTTFIGVATAVVNIGRLL